MSTPLLSEIVEKIDSYLNGLSSDRELEGWIVANLQRILDSGDTEAVRLADEIDASFVELGEGIMDQTTIRSRLGALEQAARQSLPRSAVYSITGRFEVEEGLTMLLCDQFPLGGFGKTPEAAVSMFTQSLELYLTCHPHLTARLPRVPDGQEGRFRMEVITVK